MLSTTYGVTSQTAVEVSVTDTFLVLYARMKVLEYTISARVLGNSRNGRLAVQAIGARGAYDALSLQRA